LGLGLSVKPQSITPPATSSLADPITVTITGNLAAAVRWLAFTDKTTPEKFAAKIVTDHAALSISEGLFASTDDHNEQEATAEWLSEDEKEVVVK